MRAADQWARLEESLGTGWTEARLAFRPEGLTTDAAAVLAPLQPGRVGGELRFQVRRADGGAERIRNLLERLDEKRIWGSLTLLGSTVGEPVVEQPEERRPTLVESWDAALAEQPPGWSDLLCELELESSDNLPRAALLGAALNPTRDPERIAFRFRVSGKRGYGTSPGMVRRCLERMDAERIAGRVSVLLGLSDTENAVTQGPVWRIAGRSV